MKATTELFISHPTFQQGQASALSARLMNDRKESDAKRACTIQSGIVNGGSTLAPISRAVNSALFLDGPSAGFDFDATRVYQGVISRELSRPAISANIEKRFGTGVDPLINESRIPLLSTKMRSRRPAISEPQANKAASIGTSSNLAISWASPSLDQSSTKASGTWTPYSGHRHSGTVLRLRLQYLTPKSVHRRRPRSAAPRHQGRLQCRQEKRLADPSWHHANPRWIPETGRIRQASKDTHEAGPGRSSTFRAKMMPRPLSGFPSPRMRRSSLPISAFLSGLFRTVTAPLPDAVRSTWMPSIEKTGLKGRFFLGPQEVRTKTRRQTQQWRLVPSKGNRRNRTCSTRLRAQAHCKMMQRGLKE